MVGEEKEKVEEEGGEGAGRGRKRHAVDVLPGSGLRLAAIFNPSSQGDVHGGQTQDQGHTREKEDEKARFIVGGALQAVFSAVGGRSPDKVWCLGARVKGYGGTHGEAIMNVVSGFLDGFNCSS